MGVIYQDGYTHDSHCRIYRGPDKRYKNKEICFNANEDTVTIFDVSNLEKPKYVGKYVATTKAIDHNNYIVGDHVFAADYTAGLRILDASKVAQAKLKEIAYFDIVPESDAPDYDGAWAAYPFLPSGNVIVSGMGQGLFVLTPKV